MTADLPDRATLTPEERDDLCDALMSYRLHSQGAPERFERYIVPAAERILARHRAAAEAREARVRAERAALAAAVDRIRKRHPRGDEESTYLAPGLWCPTCGRERADNGFGGCPDRNALVLDQPTNTGGR